MTLAACSNDDSKTPDTTATTTSAEQINNAPPAPYAVPNVAPNATSYAQGQNASTQPAQAVLPANAIQTPPPSAAQLGAAASDSLVTPVIHTVD